jgi:hypothetical protein
MYNHGSLMKPGGSSIRIFFKCPELWLCDSDYYFHILRTGGSLFFDSDIFPPQKKNWNQRLFENPKTCNYQKKNP